VHLAQPLDEIRPPRTLASRRLLGIVQQAMTPLRLMSRVLRAPANSRLHIDRIRRIHIQTPGATSYPLTNGDARRLRALTSATTESLKGRAGQTRLAVQVVRLRGWLAVTEEEKCDRKLAIPFN
jgi:hypothetical protein